MANANTIASLQTDLDAKLEAVGAETDPQKAGELLAEAKSIKSKIEQIQQNDASFAELKSWNDSPKSQLPQPGQGQLLQMKKAGESVIKVEGKNSVLYQDGEGLLNDKQLKLVQSDDYADAFKSYLRRGGDFNRMGRKDATTLMEGIDEQGGFLAPAEMIQRLIEREPTPTRVAGLVTQLNTSRDAVIIPKATYAADDIYSSGVRINWTGEPGNPGAANIPTFGEFRASIYTAMVEIGMTNDLLEDSGFPVQSYAGGKIREAWDIETDKMILSGSGVAQPFGMLNRIDLNSTGNADLIPFIVSGDATKITADALTSITYEIPEQYLENQQFIFNRRSTEKAIALLKDDNKRPLFYSGNDSYANARPSSLLGFNFTRSALMPNIAAGAFPVLHGDPRCYYWLVRLGVTIQVLNELEARNNKKVLLARMRAGGDVAEAFRMRALKISA